VTFNSSAKTVKSSAISPDGKYVAYSDVSGIHVKLLSTGEERTIPMPGERSEGSISYVDSWFPDGTQLLGHSRQSDDRGSMWTLSVMGQSFRELRRDAWAWQVSPDGAHIAFSPKQPFEDFHEIWVTDAEGDNAREVLGLGDAEWLWSVHWSPDGRRLAYIRAQHRLDKYFQWIESCDLKGDNRTSLLTVSDQDPWLPVQDIAWLQDGRVIYSRWESVSSADDANLWQITVDLRLGSPTSRPRRITRWAGSNLVGLTASADGTRIAFRKDIPRSQLLLGDLISPGHLRGLPRRLINDEMSVFAGDWTPDSKAVIFQSDPNGKPNVLKESITTAEPEPLVVGPKAAGLPRLSPDGAWVLYTETEAASANGGAAKYRLMRVPVSGGSPQFVLETRNATVSLGNFNCSRSPANFCVLRESSSDQKRLMLLAFDPYTGKQKLLRPIETEFGGMMSPDGTSYAGATGGQVDSRIRFLSLSGGPDREITVKGWPNLSSLDWSADGKGFYSCSVSSRGSTLLYVDLQATPQVVWRDRETIGCFGLPSPDNRHLAIGSVVNNSNIWTVENF
jgi:Tol biopolymer transport system component